jgi:hypothetical protein
MQDIPEACMICVVTEFARDHADAAEVESKRLIPSNAACLRLGQEWPASEKY